MSVESNIACSVLQIIVMNMVQLNWYSIPTPICTNGNSIFITIGALYRFGVLFPMHVSVRFYHFPFWKKIRMGIRTRNCIRSIAHFLDMVWMICGITSDKLRISRCQGSPYFVKFPLKTVKLQKIELYTKNIHVQTTRGESISLIKHPSEKCLFYFSRFACLFSSKKLTC